MRSSELRMERPSDGSSSQKRYASLKAIQEELAKFRSEDLNEVGVKAALAGRRASLEGPRAGSVYNDNRKVGSRVFNTIAEYGGDICCKDKEYMATGPFSTGGNLSFNNGGFLFYKKDGKLHIASSDKERNWLRRNKTKEGVENTGRIGGCPEGWARVASYHTHHTVGPEPSKGDKIAATGAGLPEFISGTSESKPTVGRLDPNGVKPGEIITGVKNTGWKIIYK